ncbi:MAG: hypothetical protein MUO72_13475 [Bacteroidales bacterium]|nr:hypothetical protein [Bacteroidales bacterium]
MEKLESNFHAAMEEIYQLAKQECHYSARRYKAMLNRLGGLATAKRLLHKKISKGFIVLRDAGRLDLTAEALVCQPQWRELFTSEELQIAQERIRKH